MDRSENYRNEREEKQSVAGLYLVATPIGHAQDITLRALALLRDADVIYCEDTRQTQKLLALHGITGKKCLSAHEHNETLAAQKILADLKTGRVVAYASDAGLPLISDPGALLVRAAVDAGYPVTSLPGANAALTALQLSGLPPLPFYFAGFLPPKSKARKDALAALAPLAATLIFYEAPHRLQETLSDMLATLGNRDAAVARELTKLHEELLRGTFSELHTTLSAREKIRGECVIVVAPTGEENNTIGTDEVDAQLLNALKTLSPRDAAFDVASRTGLKRRDLYQRILELKDAE